MTSNTAPTGSTMVLSDKTAREIFENVMVSPTRKAFGFGERMAIVNVDPQKAYTRPDLYPNTAYVTDPKQMEYTDQISSMAREKGLPVVWTHVAYMDNAADAGIWGTRTDTPDSLQNIKYGSERTEFDDRLNIDPSVDAVYTKRMPSAFFETPLQSFLVWHKIDTVVITGGSTSGCIRATAVDSLSRGYRTIVPMECVADKHESYHFANLTDLHLKYADVVKVADVIAWLDAYEGAK
ncbi:MAG: isochorismatase family protein [Ponticaulis sp.]|nr:isochorismatase family protein [Ponticaulis sp.]MDF1679711.1 isochorismatase family protein [Ponticaulis sp.]